MIDHKRKEKKWTISAGVLIWCQKKKENKKRRRKKVKKKKRKKNDE